jgi:sigma-E factor negative regulatory protein RseC
MTARVVFEKKSACEHCTAGVCDMGRKGMDEGGGAAADAEDRTLIEGGRASIEGGRASIEGGRASIDAEGRTLAEVEVLNPVGARVGQKVRVSMRPDVYLKGVLLVYGMPVMAMIAGAAAGKVYLPGFISGVDVEALSAAGGFAAFAAAFLFARYFSGRMGKNASYKPVIVEIIE